MILLLSGTSITLAHLYIKKGFFDQAFFALIITIYLAELFILYQYIEYVTSKFDISDSVYGSTFFICTGFHGFHVMIGTIFIIFITSRALLQQHSRLHHFGFEAAA
jgi:cytochrome c oxidase subunit 3